MSDAAMPNRPADRSHLLTEQRNPRTMDLHRRSVDELVGGIQEEDGAVLDAVRKARPAITALIEAAESGFVSGGRLIYLGAGTSGRLGVLDAAEAPPTFQVDPGRVVGVIAGGDAALRRSSEAREDDPHGAVADLDALGLTGDDTLVGIASGGTTPFVLGGLDWAKRRPDPPTTGLLVCTPVEMPRFVDCPVVLETGPEVITGSTRMKAGTATKLVLNTISTTLMVRSGRVYENLMVDLRATSDKLRDRAARILVTLLGTRRDGALALLDRAGGDVKTAVVMARRGLSREGAERVLASCGRRLDAALDVRQGGD